MVRILLIAFILAIAPLAAQANSVNVYLRQKVDAEVGVRFSMGTSTDALRFRPIEGAYRQTHWIPDSPEFRVVSTFNEDRIERIDGAPFRRVSLTARSNDKRLKKDYRPIAPYGGGVLIFTGHFWPKASERFRAATVFSFVPRVGASAVAFGDRQTRLMNWSSPFRHPAYVYMGPIDPIVTKDIQALVSPDAPAWIQSEFNYMVPLALAALSDEFGFELATKPNLFMAAPLGENPSQLSFSGDALPGQFQITLTGGAWSAPSEKGREMFRLSVIHEAVHLWQTTVRISSPNTPSWIHEGSADAIAAAMMVRLNFWTGGQYEAQRARAREECARSLYRGPLKNAALRQDIRAYYACGQVIAEAVATADGTDVADFWREFLSESRARGGHYNVENFHALVEKRTGSALFARMLREFIDNRHQDGARAIRQLEQAARLL